MLTRLTYLVSKHDRGSFFPAQTSIIIISTIIFLVIGQTDSSLKGFRHKGIIPVFKRKIIEFLVTHCFLIGIAGCTRVVVFLKLVLGAISFSFDCSDFSQIVDLGGSTSSKTPLRRNFLLKISISYTP